MEEYYGQVWIVQIRWSVLTSAVWLLSQIPNFLPNLLNSPSLGQLGRSYAGHLSRGKITLIVSVMCDRSILIENLPWHIRKVPKLQFKYWCLKLRRGKVGAEVSQWLHPEDRALSCLLCRRSACVCVAPGLPVCSESARPRTGQNRPDQLRNSWMFPLLEKLFERSFLCLPTGKLFQECIRQIREWIAAQVLKHVNQQFKPSDCNCTASSKNTETSSNIDHHTSTH